MIYSRLVELIEENASKLTDRVYAELITREETASFRKLSEDLVRERIYDVYSRLDSWLGKKSRSGELQEYYIRLGRKCFREGVPLKELIMSLMLIKRHLWLYVRENQFFDSTYECYQALEMNNKVVLFFDRAILCAINGYEQESRNPSEEKKGGLSRLFRKS